MDLSKKVLIVDDFKIALKVLTSTLKEIGFSEIIAVTNGQFAIEKLENDDFGLIITDRNMPVMDGLELIKYVRNNESLKDIPIIMITSDVKDISIKEALDAGANAYIEKPFTKEHIKEALDKL